MKFFKHCLLCAAALAGTLQSSAWGHAVLVKSEPAKEAALTATPKSVTLHFNEKLEPAFSKIQVINTTGQSVSKEKAALDPADPKVLSVNLEPLKPGTYTVKWATVGPDGHPRKGEYLFSVK